MPAFHLRLAVPADDPALRRLLREHPMPGSIALTFEREPDYFTAAGLDGPISQTIVAEDSSTGELLGMGTRAERLAALNGAVRAVGYMSHLRVKAGYPWGLALGRGLARAFSAFHALHSAGSVPFYLTSVVDGNQTAHRLLTSGIPGLPAARAYTRMFTYALASRRPRAPVAPPRGSVLRRAAREHIPEILDCLQRNALAQQFAPWWDAGSLFNPGCTPNLRPEDFFIVERGSRVTGCLALWDQTPFKQTRVRGYAGTLARWRWAINGLSRVAAIPNLPDPGAQLMSGFACHLAVDGFDPDVYAALLRAVYNEAARRGLGLLMTGLAEGHPLRPQLAGSYLHITYRSQIYLMAWEDGLQAADQVDDRPPGLEIALL